MNEEYLKGFCDIGGEECYDFYTCKSCSRTFCVEHGDSCRRLCDSCIVDIEENDNNDD